MMKKIVTYFFAFFLVATIIAPSVHALFKIGYDIEQCENYEEGNQDKKLVEDFEKLKIYQPIGATSLFRFLALKKHYIFKSKIDTSVYKKLETPPPELTA